MYRKYTFTILLIIALLLEFGKSFGQSESKDIKDVTNNIF